MPPLKNRLTIPRMPKRFPDFKLWVWDCLRLIARQAGTNVQIEGATSSSVGVDGEQYFKVGSGSGGSHPFKVTAAGGDEFTVQSGTAEGQVIAESTIDVGSTRPVAILAKMQYTLSIDNSIYVWAATVKTGGSAPELVSSTSTLSDVTIVTSAGDEARAVIAIIDADNNITQYTTGNIVGTFEDDGSFSGQISGSYNKNS